MAQPRLVLHGHFYQPPRENPWTEVVAVEPGAAPFHDWNERITAECYRPNAHARVVDDHGLVVALVNNYDHLSFNIGPTLAAWLEAHHPDLLEEIVAADRRTGRAIAQAYNHMILPLANERDLRTQVRWGLADFAHRFGRRAEGMWLPETAVNDAVLSVLAEEGVAFTILAPGQASRVRPLAGGDWIDVSDGSIDTRRPYRWRHPSRVGLGVDLLFYDGGLSHAVAFGLAGVSSQALVDRVVEAGRDGGLVAVATDGETFGHHHKFTERSIAYAFAVEAPRRGVRVMSALDVLTEEPPAFEVEVRESAWSCAHGVGRWREDCGCSTGGPPGWHQRWRAPLRAALDLLRDHAADVFERLGTKVLTDPWAARDAYLSVVLGARSVEDFAEEFVTGDLVLALTLLEAQRHAMLMYTSCGWFFYDLAGLETVQVLRYAARCIDLLAEAGDEPPVDAFLDVLAQASSNDPGEGDGARIWRERVLPARVDARRVVAHLALMDLLEDRPADPVLAGYEVAVAAHHRSERGALALSCGEVRLVHHRTRRATTHLYAAFRLGGLEVTGVVCEADPAAGIDRTAVDGLAEAFRGGARLTELLRRASDALGDDEFGLEAALPDAAEQVLAGAADRLADEVARLSERLLLDHRDTFDALVEAGSTLPPELRAPAELVLARRLEAELVSLALGWSEPAARAAQDTVDEAVRAGLRIDADAATAALADALRASVQRVVRGESDAAPVEFLLRLARVLEAEIDISVPQEQVYAALTSPQDDADGDDPAWRGAELRRVGQALGLAVDRLGQLG